jgi:hypothetical protein
LVSISSGGSTLLGDRVRPFDRIGIRGAIGRFAEKHHVGIGSVAQLGAAQPAHADNGNDRRGFAVFGKVGPDHRLQGGLQYRHPHRGERCAHVSDFEKAEQVRGTDASQLSAAQCAGSRDRPHRIGMASRGSDQPAGHRGGVGLQQFRAARGVAVSLDDPGCAHQ